MIGAILGGILGAGSSYLQAKNQKKTAQQALDAQNAGFNLASPYQGFGFGQAQNALQSALSGGMYQGDTIAGLDPAQQTAYSNLVNQVNATGGFGTQAGNIGSNLINAGAGFGTNAQNIFNMANPQQTMQTANMYSQNPFISDAVNSAMASGRRQVYESDIPNARLQSAGQGNPRSSRLALKEGLLETGLARNAMNLDASMRQQAFNTGLGQANNDISNALRANAGLANALSSGQNLMGFGQQYGFRNADALTKAGQMMQGQQQAEMDDAQKQFYTAQQRPLDLIGQFLGMINNGQIPSTGVPTNYMEYASKNPLLSALQGGFGGSMQGSTL